MINKKGDKGVKVWGNAKCKEAFAEPRGPMQELPAVEEPMRSLPAPAANPGEVLELEAPVSQKAGTRQMAEHKEKVRHTPSPTNSSPT